MRIAIYARYSTDLQSVTSLADQYRVCESRIKAPDVVVSKRGDDRVSGSTPVAQRPAGRLLMADALAGRFDVLMLESLDRLSRDQVELEGTVRRLEHRGIKIITADGYNSSAAGSKVLRTVKGMVAEMYLDDLRAKTHRGLTGKVRGGFIAAGKSYGYRIVKQAGGSVYEIDQEQAAVVRGIFERYADGVGCQRIAHDLNGAGIPAPRSGTWALSCIYGEPTKGAGMLNNRLYIGDQIWNRSQWIKDPDTGKRQRIVRPESEWERQAMPHLRIISDDIWAAVRARIMNGRAGGLPPLQRPMRTLFGGLILCPHCSGKMVAISARQYGCHARKDRGPSVCAGFSISRDLLDKRLLSTIREDLLSPAAAREFEVAYKAQALPDEGAAAQKTLVKLDGDIKRLVDTLVAMGGSEALTTRLRELETERKRLAAIPTAARSKVVNPTAVFREMLLSLQAALKQDAETARAIIGRLIGPVPLRLEGDEIWGDVETGAVMALAVGGSTVSVAGAGYGHCRRAVLLSSNRWKDLRTPSNGGPVRRLRSVNPRTE